MDPNRFVLLSSGYRMPIIGLGMFQAKDESEVIDTISTAIDIGYRHIDTAFAYRNEAFIGRALQKVLQSGKVRREELFIVTKLPNNGLRPDAVEYFFQKSLSELKLDYIDLYLIHFPVAAKRSDDDYALFPTKNGVFDGDETIDLVETWRVMEKLVDKGLVKSIGISNFNSQQIQRIYDAARIKPAVLQVECHAYLPQFELQEFCKKLNIAFTAYSPIGAPGQPEFQKGETKELRLLDDPKLKPICEKHGKSPAQILLRYLVQRGIIVIPKSTNQKRLKENIQIFDFCLSEEDMDILKSMARNRRYFTFESYKGMQDHPEFPFKIPY
ncbi:Alcohol dehydrogenase [NADP(+)] A, partial [Stegodyphus mimosarum]